MATQPDTNQPQPGPPAQPDTNDQNLGGNNTEVNPGEVGGNTEVDLDTQKVKTYDGDTNDPSPTKH